ncbi:THUMP domain-containing class I SAM-dependent RNA methyltransferase [Planktosalinus lacus]|uniref:RNA methyltransferase n=1 Tax=Planktosalinus lacus TaxID=1526573 RepID=A0A8J2VA20_9FLAO|nr:THUMP domain-containing protein [Planktosalinus lacus]GGD92766.1 RNA methyltransferase [Planktosalinus lacus]
MEKNFKMLAKTMYGFEDVLAKELKDLGAQQVVTGTRNVSFVGDQGFMYKANLSLRTAIKILKPIYSFKARNDEQLYRQIRKVNWLDYFGPTTTFALDATIFSDFFNHSQYVIHKVKDAIVDQLRESTGERPSIDTAHPNFQINIHIQGDQCTLSLDSSGGSLHLRGYRTDTNIAPINEVLAAGLLLQSGWKGQCDFLDPMCGSGTFLIEAAMIACNIPANINRREFGFQHWNDYDDNLFEVIENALLKRVTNFNYTIVGYDKAPSAIAKAKENIKNANLEEFIKVSHEDFFKTEKNTSGPLHIVFNPPYDERLSIDIETFYGDIGNTLKREYPNSVAWFITANLEALKFVGLRPSRKIKTFNGKLEARFVKYELYEGSKRRG